MELNLHSYKKGSVSGSVTVSDLLLDVDYNEGLIHQAVTAYAAGSRSGTKAQKNRSAVRGGGAKPWRQKGTGRARAGTSRGPIWRSGGVTFAAQPRSYTQKLNKKMYRKAIASIFSELQRSERLFVVDEIKVEEPKTKVLLKSLDGLGLGRDVLVITNEVTDNLYLASRNVYQVGVIDAAGIDPVSLVGYGKVIVTQGALSQIEADYS